MRSLAWTLGSFVAAFALAACAQTAESAPSSDEGDGGSQAQAGGGAGAGGAKADGGTGGKAIGGSGGKGTGGSGGKGTGGSGNAGGSTGSGGDGGSTGSGGAGGSGIVPGPGDSPVSGIPEVGSGGVQKPSGAAANVKLLSWAGFKGAVTFDFDDSQPSHIEHWPELKAEGVRMSFHICPPMNWASGYDAWLKDAIAQGSEVANHSMNHCNADGTRCNGSGVTALPGDQEMTDVTKYITQNLGGPREYTFAYPWGDANWAARAKTYFFIGRGIQNGMIAPTDTSEWNLPIIIANGGEAASKFNTDIDNARSQGKWVDLLFHSLLPTGQNWFAGVDITTVTGSMEHAKSVGDVWVDSMVAIGSYWIGGRAVKAATASGTSWTWTLPANFPTGRYVRVTVDGGTLTQSGNALPWNDHGYYEVALDPRALSWAP
jgi:peptidoglycan/xylan/chitin deacetylase (PgdA/CDA1 family)